MSKLRVAILTNGGGRGGGDQLILQLAKYAENIHWTGIVVEQAFENPAQVHRILRDSGGIPPIYHPKKEKSPEYKGIQYVEGLAPTILKLCEESDILLCWFSDTILKIHEYINIPTVQYIQGSDDHLKEYVTLSSDACDYHVATSENTKRLFAQKYREDLHLIYSGVDINRVVPTHGRAVQRKMWGISEKQKVLYFLGRLVVEKNASAVIQAISQLPEEWIGIIQGSGKEFSHLESEAARHAPGRIHFLDPWVHPGNPFSVSDVYILLSDFEGDPVSVKEAMVAGVPTVVSDIPVFKEHQKNFGDISMLIPTRASSKDIAEAILLADSPEFRNNIASRARAVVWEYFNIQHYARQWEELFYQIAEKESYKNRFPVLNRMEGEIPAKRP